MSLCIVEPKAIDAVSAVCTDERRPRESCSRLGGFALIRIYDTNWIA